MHLEMLIELVRERKCLYDMSEKMYSDHLLKENVWSINFKYITATR